MTKSHTLIKEESTKLAITFQSVVDLESFEILLKQAYLKSLSSKFLRIEFILKYITWLEAFQLSQLSLWILELKDKNKEIIIILPENPRIANFLEYFSFLNFLQNEEIQIDHSLKPLISYRMGRNKPFFPLTFANSDLFNEVIKRLQNDEYFNLIFEEVRDYAITRKALILNIVLKELGDNMYIHGKGRYSNFMLFKGNTNNLKYDKKFSPFEKTFFNSIKGKNFIEVIISDKGNGIPKTLEKTYLERNNISKPIDNCDIIEFSTYEKSSSRTMSERLKDLEQKLSSEIENIIPFTGLFQIKEIIKRYKGLMLIRSGNSIVSIFNYNGAEIVIKSSKLNGFKNLTNFGGTQIKLILPIVENGEIKDDRVDYKASEKAENLNYGYISFFDFFDNTTSLAKGYSELISEIETKSESNNYNAIIVDFNAKIVLDSKLIYLVICQLMIYQRRYSIIYSLINCNANLLHIVNDVLENKTDLIKAPIVTFSESFNRSLIGLSKSEQKIYTEIIITKEFQTDEQIEFTQKYPYLFIVNEQTGLVNLRHNRRSIIEFTFVTLTKNIQAYIFDSKNAIYYSNVKVLTPSGKYSPVYYEIYTLIYSKYIRPLITEWLKFGIFINAPTNIISLGKHCTELVDNSLNTILNRRQILHTEITASSFEEKIELLNLNRKYKKIFLFTDVIASGKTLTKIVKAIHPEKELTIFTITNLTGVEVLLIPELQKNIRIVSIVFDKIEFYDSLPASWAYEELITAEKETNKLLKIHERFLPPTIYTLTSTLAQYSIVKDIIETADKDKVEIYRNLFLENLIVANKAYYTKVYNKNGYMPVMYNINLLVELLSEQFIQDIVKDINELENRNKVKFKHVVHLEYEYDPFKSIIKGLLTNSPSFEIHNLPQNHLDYYSNDSNFTDSGVLIIDDAFTTGEMLYKLIDYCESKGAKYVFCYLFIKRSDFISARKLLKLKKYGNTDILFKYIFDGELPVYKGSQNPIVSSLKEIQKLRTLYYDTEMDIFLSKLSAQNSYVSITDISIFNTDNSDPSFLILRWQLEQAKSNMAFRKMLSSLFDNHTKHQNKILLFFKILQEEKGSFFDENSPGYLFYPSFKEKIITLITVEYLENRELFNSLQIYDLLTALLSLSAVDFYNYFLTKDVRQFLNDELLFPLIVVLSVSDNNNAHDPKKYLLLNKIKEFKVFESVLNLTEKYWKSESINSLKSSTPKIVYIKALLKANFHDFARILRYIESKNLSPSAVKQSWNEIKEMCNYAIKNLQSFFSDDLFPHLAEEFYSTLEQLSNNLKIGENLIFKLVTQNTNNPITDNYNILEILKKIKEIVFNDGLLLKIENNFRVEVKKHLKSAIELLSSKFNISKDIIDDECNAFFSDVSFYRVISNIYDNILNYSTGKNVFIKVYKSIYEKANLIVIEFYDDGEQIDDYTGIGMNTCKVLTEKYSGKFSIENLTIKIENTYYYKMFKISLHDLSSEILNRPTYAEESIDSI